MLSLYYDAEGHVGSADAATGRRRWRSHKQRPLDDGYPDIAPPGVESTDTLLGSTPSGGVCGHIVVGDDVMMVMT